MICLKINEQLLYCIFSLHGCSDRSATKQLHEHIMKNFVQVDRILVIFLTPLLYVVLRAPWNQSSHPFISLSAAALSMSVLFAVHDVWFQ